MQVTRTTVMLWAAAVAVIGLAVAGWFAATRRPPPAHPETADFERVDEPRVTLIDAFQSYAREAAVSDALAAAQLTAQRQVQQRPLDPRYPPRRMSTLTIDAYRHLGCDGRLELLFFNDRLMEADFRPEDAARYAPRLHQSVAGLRLDGTGHAETIDGPLRVWSSVDLARSKVGRTIGSEGLVLWQDRRLIAQRDDWDARFGGIPVPFQR